MTKSCHKHTPKNQTKKYKKTQKHEDTVLIFSLRNVNENSITKLFFFMTSCVFILNSFHDFGKMQQR